MGIHVKAIFRARLGDDYDYCGSVLRVKTILGT